MNFGAFDLNGASINKMKNAFKSLFFAALCALPTCFADSISTRAVSDAFVAAGPAGNLATNNYGGGGALALAASALPNGEFQSVIKFDLAATRTSLDTQFGAGNWSIQSVTLQLSSSPHSNNIYNDIAAGAFNVSLLQNNSWVEGTGTASVPSATGITFNTLQSTFINNATDQPLGTFNFPGGSSGANSYNLTLSSGLTSAIASGSQLSLRLSAADNVVSYLFTSRANTTPENQPTLIVTVPEPTTLALFGISFAIFATRLRPSRSTK